MKVKPSVKKICEKCKTIRRHGVVMVICSNPATSPAAGADRRGWRYRAHMARIAGVDLPATSGWRSASPTSSASAGPAPSRRSRVG